jgi:hypothetical protein
MIDDGDRLRGGMTGTKGSVSAQSDRVMSAWVEHRHVQVSMSVEVVNGEASLSFVVIDTGLDPLNVPLDNQPSRMFRLGKLSDLVDQTSVVSIDTVRKR